MVLGKQTRESLGQRIAETVHGRQNHGRTDRKLTRQWRLKENGRTGGTHDDGNARRQALEDIVGVLDDRRHEHTTARLQQDQEPSPRRKAVQIRLALQLGRALLDEALHKGNEDRVKGELHVAHPETGWGDGSIHVLVGFLEDFLKVDARKSRGQAGDRHGNETEQQVLVIVMLFRFLFSEDDNGNTETEHDEADPLLHRVGTLQHDDTDNRCRDEFGLIGDLKDGSREVGERHVEEGVLNEVQESRNENLESIKRPRENVVVDALPEFPLRGVELERCREHKLCDLNHENEVIDFVELLLGDSSASVPTNEDCGTVLEDHHDEQDELEGAKRRIASGGLVRIVV